MPLSIGIVGLPNVGKSTLFNAITRTRGAQAANYPFCTIEPNIGIVEVPDPRLQALAALVNPQKVVPATVTFVDIAGLVKGAHAGEGLGNQFLHHIREVQAICHVVRAFDDGDILHVEGSVDPKRDQETIETELALADLASLKSRREKIQGAARTGDKEKLQELALLEKLEEPLQKGKSPRGIAKDSDEEAIIASFQLLTTKPQLLCMNVAEGALKEAQKSLSPGVIHISAKIEEDLQDFSTEEAASYLKDLGVTSSGLDRLIRAAYTLLGLQTYFTAGPQEVRAWTIGSGTTAPQAAGVIHTDFERGFICAEIIGYDDFIACGGEKGAREKGKLRLEGKQYVMQDGDVCHFRFNV